MKLEVDRHVYQTTHLEYGEEGSATLVNVAELPSINMTVDTPKDLEYSAWDNQPEEIDLGGNQVARYWGARTHMLVVQLYLSGEGTGEASRMSAAVTEFVQVNPELDVLADQDLYPGEEDKYPVEISRDPVVVTGPNDSNVVTYSMTLQVRGIAVLPGEPTEIVRPIQDFLLAIADFGMTAPVEMTF
jgi:hypothetical protein